MCSICAMQLLNLFCRFPTPKRRSKNISQMVFADTETLAATSMSSESRLGHADGYIKYPLAIASLIIWWNIDRLERARRSGIDHSWIARFGMAAKLRYERPFPGEIENDQWFGIWRGLCEWHATWGGPKAKVCVKAPGEIQYIQKYSRLPQIIISIVFVISARK